MAKWRNKQIKREKKGKKTSNNISRLVMWSVMDGKMVMHVALGNGFKIKITHGARVNSLKTSISRKTCPQFPWFNVNFTRSRRSSAFSFSLSLDHLLPISWTVAFAREPFEPQNSSYPLLFLWTTWRCKCNTTPAYLPNCV